MNKVRPRAEVIAEAKKNGVSAHLGTLMGLCHLKHAALSKIIKSTKAEPFFVAIQSKTRQVSLQSLLNKVHQHRKWQQRNS